MFDPSDVREWRNLRPGSTILLKDERSMMQMLQAGGSLQPMECVVDEITRIVVNEGVGEFLICHMPNSVDPDENGTDLWFASLFVDGNHDHRLYFEPADRFEPGTRDEILDRGDNFIFLPPEDPDDFVPTDLEFTGNTFHGDDEYDSNGRPTLFGDAIVEPRMTGMQDEMFAAIRELSSPGCDNPEMMIIEIGGINPNDDYLTQDRGGLVRLWIGRQVKDNDFEVIPGGGRDGTVR